MVDVVLAHDYLVQVGGAERVVAEWAAGFGGGRVVPLAYRQESTFDAFRELDVRATIPGPLAMQVERMLPVLPAIPARTTEGDGDVALVSSSGWAHRFRFEVPHVEYVHSPARWLYAAADYHRRFSRVRCARLRMATPRLRLGDAEVMGRVRALVANSAVTRDQIRAVYGLDSIVVHPPVEPVSSVAEAPARDLLDGFAVVVARDRGYKNVALAVEAAHEARMPIVIVGAGSASLDDPESGVHGLGRVADAELCWVYRHAAVIVGAGGEDFGRSVRPGGNGFLAASETPADLANTMRRARELDADRCRDWARGFGRDAHVARLGHQVP